MLRGLLGGYARGRRQTSSATLSLNFLDGINDSRITYSGGANGTRVNSAGVIVAATAPRFDYNPVTLAAKGLLVEEARTNLLLRSADFSVTWVTGGSTTTAAATSSPDGATNGTKLAEDSGTSTHVVQQFIAFSNATSYTMTAYLKASERSWGWLFFPAAAFTALSGCYFDLANGVVGSAISTGVTASIAPAGNGWYRCSITKTSTAAASGNTGIGTATTDLTNNYTGTTGSGVFVWGAQIEAGAFPTSYIPTTTASVTRTADSAVMTGTNFSDWYNQSEGTFAFQYANAPTDSARPVVVVRRSGDSNYRLQMDTAFSYAIDAGVITSSTGTGSAKAGAKIASAFKTDDFATSTNGGAVSVDASGANPNAMDQMTIGYFDFGSAARLNGHIQSIAFYPRRMADSQLQTLTA